MTGETKRMGGFTLLELIAALAVLSLLLTVGLPSLENFRASARRAEASSDLLNALQHARLDAVNRGVAVFVCARDASAGAGAVCDLTDSAQWSNGWMVFTEVDGDRQVLTAREPLDDDLQVSANFAGTPLVKFDTFGRAGQSVSFKVCGRDGRAHGNQVTVTYSGQIAPKEFNGCAVST